MKDEYFAGLFDGEGHIGTAVRKKGGPYIFTIRLGIGMADWSLPLLMRVHNQYGGVIRKQTTVNTNMTYIWWHNRWDVKGVLLRIEPYLDLKREQAKLVLWWFEYVEPYSNQWGIVEARKHFVENLGLLKKTPYFPAEEIIEKIKGYQLANVPVPLFMVKKNG